MSEHRDDLGRYRGKPWIVCAANRRADGLIVAGARHWDPIMQAQMGGEAHFKAWEESEQGFIDQHGAFYTREAAWDLALANGQLDSRYEPGSKTILTSEDLY